MSQTVLGLFDAALALPELQRAELVEMLSATLTSPIEALHPKWAAELRRRAAKVDTGVVQPIPWDDVRSQVQAKLDVQVPSNG